MAQQESPMSAHEHTPLQYQHFKRCERKADYRSIGRAAEVARERSIRIGEWLIAYECIDCGGFHIGHASPEDQKLLLEQDKKRIHRCNNCGKPSHGTYCGKECRKQAGKK